MSQRRNRRAGVVDLWYLTTKDDQGQPIPSARHGRGKRWRALYVDSSGREQSKAFTRKVDAQNHLDTTTSQLVTGTYVAPRAGTVTVAELHQQWLGQQGHVKESTKAARESAWNAHVSARWGRVEVADVQTSAVRAWVSELAAPTVDENGTERPGSSAATIENALGVLRMVCAVGVEDRRIVRNPCDGVKPPRRAHSARAYLTHKQVDELARQVGGDGALIVRFLAYTGLRFGELAALRVRDFDMLRRRVQVRESVTEVKGKLVWSTPKTHEQRSVPFPKFLLDDLAAQMSGRRRDEYVFTAPRGGVLRIATFRTRSLNRAVDALRAVDDKGVPATDWPRPTLHDLRHTAASLAISAGANVKAVQTMLGHRSAVLTLDTYADLFDDDLEAVADALDTAARAALA